MYSACSTAAHLRESQVVVVRLDARRAQGRRFFIDLGLAGKRGETGKAEYMNLPSGEDRRLSLGTHKRTHSRASQHSRRGCAKPAQGVRAERV
jgi:hypothetical protein